MTPARADLAAAHLEGTIAAPRYSVGVPWTIGNAVADIRREPRPDAPLETQALHGEPIVVYDDDEDGWGWVQLGIDGYVGYVAMHALSRDCSEPTHVVAVNRTFVYPAPDMKQPVLDALPLGARLVVERTVGSFVRLTHGRFVVASHVAPVPQPSPPDAAPGDFVAVAERFLGVPYLWGGRTPLGVDCSGLVQTALAQTGRPAPRDTDMQEAVLGVALDLSPTLAGLRRGDLVFWAGHVGIMQDAERLIHANAHHMLVETEPLQQAVHRILAGSQATIRSIRRITKN